jgi:polyribonucleotide nucleotidyltransferase
MSASTEQPIISAVETVLDNGAFGKRTIKFETGLLARQAAGSVTAYLDDETMLLSATTAGKHPKEQFDFFPLTIDVEERMYAVGQIPGSFFRSEGRPGEDAILTCRLIDRPLRPTFKKGLRNEVQVVITVLALDPDQPYDVLAINAASLSTQISGLPFSGPVGGVRVALIEGQWVAFPSHSQLEGAVFDMVVAGRVTETGDVAIMMVEAEATEQTWDLVQSGTQAPTEEIVAGGLDAAKPFIKQLCEAQSELAKQASKPIQEFPVFLDYEDDVFEAVESASKADLLSAMTIVDKQERELRVDELKTSLLEKLTSQFEGREKEIGAAFRSVNKQVVRERVLRDKVRIDGRGLADIRPLHAEVGILPRVHGSALFERGETQILGVTTLDMLKMEQQLDTLSPEKHRRYMHKYVFPPFSTGETGRVGSPKRREVGHGALARRALLPVLPTREEFPYAMRQLSEAMGSNGSTSMGSVCASTMSLLQAGVPLRAAVAGIAMGLISGEVDGETSYVALTDILGAEDAFGDMDFKVAGTKEFVTALQLDTKLDGIPAEVLAAALTQARDARLTILEVMAEAIDAPEEMSVHAPRIISIKVPVDKIGEVIGPKGKVINQIQDDTGATLSIEDDGTVYIGATNGEAAEAARNAVNAIANPTMPEVGERYLGTVVKTTNFGAFVSLLPGKDGLLHITKLRALVGGKRVENVDDVVSVGQKIQVEIGEIDDRGKLSLIPVVEDSSAPAGDESADSAVDVAADAESPTWYPRRPAGSLLPAGRRFPRAGDRPGPCSRTMAASYAVPCCPAGCGSSPSRYPVNARPPSASGSASVRATSHPRSTAAPTSWSTCCSRAPPSARRSTSRSPSTPSAASSTPSPPRSSRASTRGCSTRTSRWQWTCSAT